MPLRIRMRVVDVIQKLNARGYATEQQLTLRAVKDQDSDDWSSSNPPEAAMTMTINVPAAFDNVRLGQFITVLLVPQ